MFKFRQLWVALPVMLGVCAVAPAAAQTLKCNTSVAPPKLTVTLTNTGKQGVWLLAWNTPFETPGGWFGPWLTVERDGQPVPFQGPMLKRGDPERSNYFHLRAGRSRKVTVDMSLVFQIDQKGSYKLRPQIFFLDRVPLKKMPWPRTRADFVATNEIDCPGLSFTR
jgi:peptidyl-Lys metalloendopeptidase